MRITLALKQNNEKAMKDILNDVSDPRSSKYGQHMKLEDLRDLYAPKESVVTAFDKWLSSINALDVDWTFGRDFVHFSLRVRDLRAHLGLEAFVYKHIASGRTIIRSDLRLDDPDVERRNSRGLSLLSSLPAELRPHLELSLGLFDIFDTKDERMNANDLLRATKRRQQSSSLLGASGNSTNQPIIMQISGATSDLNIYFQPVCQNGQLPSNPATLCGEFGNTIIRFSVIVKPSAYDATEIILEAKDARCAIVNEAPLPPPNDNGTTTSDQIASPSARERLLLQKGRKMIERRFNLFSSDPLRQQDGKEDIPKLGSTIPVINCIASAKLPYPLLRANVSVQSVFSTQEKSGRFYYPTAYAPTEYIMPQSIFDLYGVPASYRSTHPENSQAIVSFEQQYINTDDLHTFQDLMGQRRMDCNIIGPNDPAYPGGESTLDVQYVMGVGVGVNTTCWSFEVGDYILNWAIAVGDTPVAPLVTSISYGDTETGYEQKSGYGLQYIYRMNSELIKMGIRGLTVIAGSGDAGWSNVGEMGNDLSAPDPTCSPMRAFYPSDSPYVLSLSATFVGLNAVPACSSFISPNPDDHVSSVPIICNRPREIAVSVTDGMSWFVSPFFWMNDRE